MAATADAPLSGLSTVRTGKAQSSSSLTMRAINFKNHACAEAPLEAHPFESSLDNDYLCKICHRPRALHEQDDFTSKTGPDMERAFPMKPGWKNMTIRGKTLTDRKIDSYRRRGYYSESFRQARREMWARRSSKSANFLELEGRLIYSPK